MKTYVLTYREKNAKVAVKLFQHEFIQEVQRMKAIYKRDSRYCHGIFQVRTLEGFLAKNVLKES